MIVVDTSALMAILLNEPSSKKIIRALQDEDLVISAGTAAEALIVANRRNVGREMETMIDRLGFEVAPVMPADARLVAQAYEQWGKGLNPAGLNFGNCFAYALAKARDCPLLFVGDDFSATDIRSAI